MLSDGAGTTGGLGSNMFDEMPYDADDANEVRNLHQRICVDMKIIYLYAYYVCVCE